LDREQINTAEKYRTENTGDWYADSVVKSIDQARHSTYSVGSMAATGDGGFQGDQLIDLGVTP